jgi:ABC-type nitrate/sulfonate/bicarbonate transport system permease component
MTTADSRVTGQLEDGAAELAGSRPSRRASGGGPSPAGVRRYLSKIQTAVSIVCLVVLWQVLVSILHPNQLAIVGPWETARQVGFLFSNGTLGADLRVSGEEFGIGFAVAIVLGVGLGVLLGTSRRLAALFDPWVMIFYTVPVIAIAPMIIIGLGITLTAKVIIVSSASLFPILLNTQAGVRNLDRGLREVAVAFRAGRLEALRYVVLPGSIPYILTGVRLGVGRGLVSLVAGDLFGATAGVGYLILSGEQNLDTASVYVGVAVLSIFGILLTQLVGLVERRFDTYRVDGRGR